MKPLLVGVAFSLVVASCASGGDTADTDAMADAIADGVWEQSQADIAAGEELFEFDRSDADCIGAAVVDALGFDTLQEAGLTAEALSEEGSIPDLGDMGLDAAQGAEVFDAMDGCIDFANTMAEVGAADMDISVASAECLFDGFLAEESFRDMMVAGMMGEEDTAVDPLADPAFAGTTFALMSECLSDEELARLLEG
ncbi:MAG: hypothetical protein BMS9Abin07_2374 [Acidimicrobiia bacterium]|nr:MAG: hypothetical protein BMS9Abin07_2374 [Acidimicrobiia bacterium]